VQIPEILPAIKAEIETENEQFLKEKAEYIKRRDNLTIKVSYLDNPYVVSIFIICFVVQILREYARRKRIE